MNRKTKNIYFVTTIMVLLLFQFVEFSRFENFMACIIVGIIISIVIMMVRKEGKLSRFPVIFGKIIKNEIISTWVGLLFMLTAILSFAIMLEHTTILLGDRNIYLFIKLLFSLELIVLMVLIVLYAFDKIRRARVQDVKILFSGLSKPDGDISVKEPPRNWQPIVGILKKYPQIIEIYLLVSRENMEVLNNKKLDVNNLASLFKGWAGIAEEGSLIIEFLKIESDDDYYQAERVRKYIERCFEDKRDFKNQGNIMFNLTSAPVPISVAFSIVSVKKSILCIYSSQGIIDKDPTKALMPPFLFDTEGFIVENIEIADSGSKV